MGTGLHFDTAPVERLRASVGAPVVGASKLRRQASQASFAGKLLRPTGRQRATRRVRVEH